MIKEIKKAQLEARKAKNKWVAGILTALLSDISAVGKNDGNRETTNEEALKVVQKFKKGVQETIRLQKDSGENAKDLTVFYNEIKIYDMFLPNQFDESRLRNMISGIIVTLDNPNIGCIMSILKTQIPGQYDGKMASKLIRELL